MRTQAEIQEAHDICIGVILREVPNPFGPGQLKSLNAAASVLCWVLNHEHNDTFEKNLTVIREQARKAGFTLQRKNN